METRRHWRRARDERLLGLRAFASEHAWQVTAMTDDLARRPALAAFNGAYSAQAELAVTGPWGGRQATVASVLVRQPSNTDPARPAGLRDQVVLLTIVRLTASSPGQDVLLAAVQAQSLPAGQAVVLIDDELLHTGPPDRQLSQKADVQARLNLLARLSLMDRPASGDTTNPPASTGSINSPAPTGTTAPPAIAAIASDSVTEVTDPG